MQHLLRGVTYDEIVLRDAPYFEPVLATRLQRFDHQLRVLGPDGVCLVRVVRRPVLENVRFRTCSMQVSYLRF